MEQYDVYRQIAQRTGGEIHIGVVGPVRTGKSTLIRRFMDLMVVPGVDNEWRKERLVDELPQSAAGRTIMTTQMQFVPGEAVEVSLPENTHCRVRLVDCVGYMVEGALGMLEEGTPRMVRTPWFDEEVPFEVAAETGTRKVITEHSTLGIVVTTDGSITDLPREAYLPAEQRVVSELSALGKPFVVVINAQDPGCAATQNLQQELSEAYGVPVMALDVLHMEEADVADLLTAVLYEFPARQMHLAVPGWLKSLPRDHWLWQRTVELLREGGEHFDHLRDYSAVVSAFAEEEQFRRLDITSIHPGDGTVEAQLELPTDLYFQVLSEVSGCEVANEAELMGMMSGLMEAKQAYDRLRSALEQVKATGYGLVTPSTEELTLEEPQLVKQGGQYGVKLRASAPSWHIMQVDIDTEVSPTVGTEKQGEDLLHYMMDGFENDPDSIWQTDIFGKSLYDLVREGLNQKLSRVPEDSREKIREAMSHVVNDSGNGGMICILL